MNVAGMLLEWAGSWPSWPQGPAAIATSMLVSGVNSLQRVLVLSAAGALVCQTGIQCVWLQSLFSTVVGTLACVGCSCAV